MRGAGEPANCTSGADRVERVCAHVRLSPTGKGSIEGDGDDAARCHVALDVGNHCPGKGRGILYRNRPRPLTARRLYDYLSRELVSHKFLVDTPFP